MSCVYLLKGKPSVIINVRSTWRWNKINRI